MYCYAAPNPFKPPAVAVPALRWAPIGPQAPEWPPIRRMRAAGGWADRHKAGYGKVPGIGSGAGWGRDCAGSFM